MKFTDIQELLEELQDISDNLNVQIKKCKGFKSWGVEILKGDLHENICRISGGEYEMQQLNKELILTKIKEI